jgi:hypothetical protein
MVDVRDDGDVAPQHVGDGRGGFLRSGHPFSLPRGKLMIADCRLLIRADNCAD